MGPQISVVVAGAGVTLGCDGPPGVRFAKVSVMSSLLRPLLCVWLALAAVPAAADVRLADARPAAELRSQQERTDLALAAREKLARAARDAARARDQAAQAVARLKQKSAPGLESALRDALTKDEAYARATAQVAAADADVAKEGARLLRLYDAVLADRRRAVDAAPAARRKEAVDTYRALVAQRDAVRRALAPVLSPTSPIGVDVGPDLTPGADDDVETLLEKADLARDLEARLRRRADAVRRRIAELRDEAVLEGDVADALARGQLFDEEDRRLSVTRTDLAPARAAGLPGTTTQDRGAEGPQLQSNDGTDTSGFPAVGAAVTSTTTTSTAERPIALSPELLASHTPTSLAELQALEAQLAQQIKELQAKEAALKKAAAKR